MKEVTKTKQPSTKQMLAMAENLREKFGKPSCIEIRAWKFTCTQGLEFRIYVEDIASDNQQSWIGCQNCYFALMAQEVKNDEI